MINTEQRLLWQDKETQKQCKPCHVHPGIKATVLISISVVILIGMVLSTAKLIAPQSNPLAPYVDILPGRVKSVLAPHGFRCYAANESIELCVLNRTTGAVRSIHVIMRFDIIFSVNIQLRSGALSLGDLALLWGKPDPHEQGYSRQFDWSRHNASVTVAPFVGGFSYLLHVQAVSFGETNINRNRAL